jgi:hypothetical protein
VIVKIVYGLDVAERCDPYIEVAEKAIKGMAEAARPGAFWVDVMPFRKSDVMLDKKVTISRPICWAM